MKTLGIQHLLAQILRVLPLTLPLALPLQGCGGGGNTAGAPSAPSEPPGAAPASELPPSHPPIAPAATPSGAANAPAPAGPAAAGGLRWEHQAPLERRAPKSSMRAAEYGVKDGPLAELTVFYFGPDQGGSVDANITRWLGQLVQADGTDTAKVAKRSTREVSGVNVTQVEATGRFGGSMGMPGAPPAAEIPDAMLLGAIASGPEGPVFFKLIGPRASVESARGAFDALIGSLRR